MEDKAGHVLYDVFFEQEGSRFLLQSSWSLWCKLVDVFCPSFQPQHTTDVGVQLNHLLIWNLFSVFSCISLFLHLSVRPFILLTSLMIYVSLKMKKNFGIYFWGQYVKDGIRYLHNLGFKWGSIIKYEVRFSWYKHLLQ